MGSWRCCDDNTGHCGFAGRYHQTRLEDVGRQSGIGLRHQGRRAGHQWSDEAVASRCVQRHETCAREHGKLRSEGKEYVVHDGDCLHFKFAV